MSQQTNAGGDTSDAARQEADRLQRHAGDQAQQVADTAKGQAQRVADEARQQAVSLVGDARQHALRQAEDQTTRLSGALHEWSQQADALLDGRPEDAGPLGDWARQLSGQLEEIADRIDRLGFRGVVDEVQRFARRRPGAFLLGAAAAGFGVARLGRGAQAAQASDGSAPIAGESRGNTGPAALPEPGDTAPTTTAGAASTAAAEGEQVDPAAPSEVQTPAAATTSSADGGAR